LRKYSTVFNFDEGTISIAPAFHVNAQQLKLSPLSRWTVIILGILIILAALVALVIILNKKDLEAFEARTKES
jgi:hypothetical protein